MGRSALTHAVVRRSAVCVVLIAGIVASGSQVLARQDAASRAATCSGTATGNVSTLTVPRGGTCTAANLAVAGDVTIEQDATLVTTGGAACNAGNSFSVGGRISVASGGALLVNGTGIAIGGSVTAQDARAVAIMKTPCQGASGVVQGDIVVEGTRAVTLLGLEIGGNVSIRRGGSDGVEAGTNRIGGTVSVENTTVRGPSGPALFAVHMNRIARGLSVTGNNATGASQPPLVSGNTISSGDLTCANNDPPPTNVDVDQAIPNVVVDGQKVDQCAGL